MKNTAPKVIVSLSCTESMAKKAKLLAKLEGTTITALFTSALERDLNERLKTALASIKDEVEAA